MQRSGMNRLFQNPVQVLVPALDGEDMDEHRDGYELCQHLITRIWKGMRMIMIMILMAYACPFARFSSFNSKTCRICVL